VRWTPGGVSDDIEDRRDDGGGPSFGGFGPHLGIGGVIIVGLLSLVFHRNFFALFYGGPDSAAPVERSAPRPPADRNDKQVQFVSFVLDDVQHTWETLLPQDGNRQYRHAKLVLFRDVVQSGCGQAQSAMGPFYCPEDEKVYLDLGFFDELRTRFGAPGEFAEAYVIAHEVGHHVQKLLGIEAKVRRLQQQDPREQNPLSVRLELQADCFAGVWGHSTQQRNIIDQSDVASALKAAAAVGDDRLQKQATGRVVPDSFTHGSSAQRTHWFQTGLDGGQISACNTFQGN
jgi:predicted metalloprotease